MVNPALPKVAETDKKEERDESPEGRRLIILTRRSSSGFLMSRWLMEL